MAARTRFFRARPLILSPSKKSIARHVLPPKPALKSLSGSGRFAPWEKVIFTLSLWALATAIIPSRDHTGLPIHFHSSMISPSASRMLLRMLANVLPRQSVSPAISWSISTEADSSGTAFFMVSLHLSQANVASLGVTCNLRRWGPPWLGSSSDGAKFLAGLLEIDRNSVECLLS